MKIKDHVCEADELDYIISLKPKLKVILNKGTITFKLPKRLPKNMAMTGEKMDTQQPEEWELRLKSLLGNRLDKYGFQLLTQFIRGERKLAKEEVIKEITDLVGDDSSPRGQSISYAKILTYLHEHKT